jgi:photosystem II stability/assembly factor-like uncharacterized protein
MKKGLFLFLICFIHFSLVTLPGRASPSSLTPVSSWVEIGPEGGEIRGLAFNSKNQNEMYAVSSSGQVFKTTNSGGSWQRIAFLDDSLQDIVCHPLSQDVIYVLGSRSVFKSSDGSKTWTRYPLAKNCFGDEGQIAIHPKDSRILYIAGNHLASGKRCMAVLKSVSGGKTWEVTRLAPFSIEGYAYFISVNPTNPNIVYTGGYYSDKKRAYIFKTIDEGKTWQDITGATLGIPYDMVIDPINSSKVYVGTSHAIYRSLDGGRIWLQNNGIAFARALGINSSNPNILYASFDSGWIYKSANGGIDWIVYRTEIEAQCFKFLVLSKKIFFSSAAGIWKSLNSGVTWKSSYSGIKATKVPTLAIATSSPKIVYSVAYDHGVFKSKNAGQSWETTWPIYGCISIPKIEVSPQNPNTVFVILMSG